MTSERHRFDDLESMIDQVHALFEGWDDVESGSSYSSERLHRARLAVHEWLANLIQHARFPENPEVWLEVNRAESELECVIEDNSDGFDLAGTLESRQKIADAFPERGMGLLLLNACTHDLTYMRNDAGRQQLRFRVSDGYKRPINIPF
jgi:serine/threonine-protein kinase RsbW